MASVSNSEEVVWLFHHCMYTEIASTENLYSRKSVTQIMEKCADGERSDRILLFA